MPIYIYISTSGSMSDFDFVSDLEFAFDFVLDFVFESMSLSFCNVVSIFGFAVAVCSSVFDFVLVSCSVFISCSIQLSSFCSIVFPSFVGFHVLGISLLISFGIVCWAP